MLIQKRDIDINFPTPRGEKLQVTCLVDSDNIHDIKAHQSINNLVGLSDLHL